jgi:hypothetical protein
VQNVHLNSGRRPRSHVYGTLPGGAAQIFSRGEMMGEAVLGVGRMEVPENGENDGNFLTPPFQNGLS